MAKIAFLIDGFNLYHALNLTSSSKPETRFRKYKWLNLWKFASLFVGSADTLEKVLLFTAFATSDPEKVTRHKILIRTNESVGVSVVLASSNAKTSAAGTATNTTPRSKKNRQT